METVADFICLGSKITADDDCNHEIKKHLLLGRKVMTNLDSVFSSVQFSRSVLSDSLRPHESQHARPPWSDLRSPGIISKHGGFRTPDGNSARVRERERHGETSISRNSSHSLFSRVCIYTLRWYTQVTWGQQS